MQNMKMSCSIFALLLLRLGCKKEPLPLPPPTPPPTPQPSLKVRWQHALSPDTTDVFGAAWYTWEGRVIYSTNFTVPEGQIHCRDAATGELLWKRDDLYTDGWGNRSILSVADKTLASTSRRNLCIDNKTGAYVWKLDLTPFYSSHRLYGAGEFMYTSLSRNPPFNEEITLVRTHHSSGQLDTLFNILHDNYFYPNLGSVALWINPQGDSIIMVPVTMLGSHSVHGANQRRANLYAFNLRTRQMEWQLLDFDPKRSNCPIYPPVISDNRLYINCNKTLNCIDLLSGTLVWTREFPSPHGSDIRYNSLKEHGNLILLVSDHEDVAWGISKTDGSTVWENREVAAAADELTIFEGVLYYTSRATGRLYAIEAATGATLWKMRSPNSTSKRQASFGFQQLCIDPVGRLMYVTDGYFIMCVELAK